MITLYELKNKSFCRCFIRTPFYVKNLFLLGILALIQSVIYLVYFSGQGSGGYLRLQNINKILKGLNSDTFNYLWERKDALKISALLNNYQDQIDTNLFIDECLRISKPCKFAEIAKKWPQFESLKYTHDGKPYGVLEDAIGSN
jgi:hypothetical protein